MRTLNVYCLRLSFFVASFAERISSSGSSSGVHSRRCLGGQLDVSWFVSVPTGRFWNMTSLRSR